VKEESVYVEKAAKQLALKDRQFLNVPTVKAIIMSNACKEVSKL
jgi:hypothetical protein